MECATLLGYGASTPDATWRQNLPFATSEIERHAIPAPLRRRASQATQLAFSAAALACQQAGRTPDDLPAVFASVGGEIQVTDILCLELAKPDGFISPTAFHNAVHNTAAAYWSIAHGVTASTSALAAGLDTFAMAVVESWCLLDTMGGEMLLVCYDERWPEYLAAPLGAQPFAAALILAAGSLSGGLARLGRPRLDGGAPLKAEWADWIARVPAAAAIPLLAAAASPRTAGSVALSAGPAGWSIPFESLRAPHGKMAT